MSEPQAAAPAAPAVRPAAVSAIEVAIVTGFLLAYIWLVDPRAPAYRLPAFALFFAFTWRSHRRHRDTTADLGIRLDTFGVALKEALLVIAPALLLALAFGAWAGGGVHLDPGRTALAFLWSYPWALFQQYGLQCVIGRRLSDVIARPVAHDLASAAIFASLHLPNPFLASVTFGAAYCFCALFRRSPNLFALALAHTVASTVLYHVLPAEITHLMRVGPRYFEESGDL